VSRAQRLTFLGIALLIAVVAVVIVLASGGDDEKEADTGGAQATATATPSAGAEETPGSEASPEPTETPEKPAPPTLVAGKVTKMRFTEGELVRFRVKSDDVADEVHVHGYDLMKDIEPGQTISFQFPATITGIFEVEFEDAGEQIGQLRVDPK
jgi:hypothetical protein